MNNYWLDKARAIDETAGDADRTDDTYLSTCKYNNEYTNAFIFKHHGPCMYFLDEAVWISQSLTKSYLAHPHPSEALLSFSSTLSSSLALFVVSTAWRS